MFTLIDRTKSGNNVVLDTEDGVVTYILDEELRQYRNSGFRFYKTDGLSFLSSLYTYMIKCITLRKDFDYNFYRDFHHKLLVLSMYVKYIKIPINIYAFTEDVKPFNNMLLVRFRKRTKDYKDYLYAVTKEGIFYFTQWDFCNDYSIEIYDNYIEVTSDRVPMNYCDYIVDNRLNICKKEMVAPTLGVGIKL